MIGKTIDQIKVNEEASWKKTITQSDVEKFGEIIEDYNPAHYDETYAASTVFKKRISHGMLVGSLFSKLFGLTLPGKGTIYVKQSLKFTKPVYFKDVITATVCVKEIIKDRNRVTFECVATNQNGEIVVVGEAEVMPPKKEV
jgi:acyl dehydratase